MKILQDFKKLLKPAVSLLIVGLFFQITYGQKQIEFIESNEKIIGVKFSGRFLDCKKKLEECFNVVVQNESIAIVGTWSEKFNDLIFKPTWPFAPGITYQIYHQKKPIGSFTIPPRISNEHYSLQVFPSADTLPENLLKMYLQFSEPVQQVRSEQYVHMLNEEGDTLNNIFQKLHPELWNADEDRLTLWIDPGRVKRELIRNQKLGPPFEKGKHYTLVVSSDWKSQSGSALKTDFEKTFYVGEEDRSKPDPENWKLLCPKANTLNPLTISFNEPMDYALLMDAFSIKDQNGNTINNEITIIKCEKQISFLSIDNWETGEYKLIIDAKLEDLAGNNLNRLFDVDLKQDKIDSEEKEEWVLEFRVE